jgi:hypothetical protein
MRHRKPKATRRVWEKTKHLRDALGPAVVKSARRQAQKQSKQLHYELFSRKR